MKEYATTTGQAVDSDTGKAIPADGDDFWAAQIADTFALLPLHLVVPSLTNPRKTFNRVHMDELVAGVKAIGITQPIRVRPLPGSRVAETFDTGQPGMPRPTHEIIFGQRRYRACVEAGLSVIPALICHRTDAEVLQIQMVENVQRENLLKLEEAEGFERMMQATGETADAVGAKIGKSRSYVYASLKLLDLCQEAKQALREGAIDASRALLIARIPDGKLQIKATAYASEAHSGEVPSVRLLQTWLRQNVMLPLDRAPFVIVEDRLIPEAGSCKNCPKRTGAAPDMFADVQGADICTDPPCYNLKAEAHTARLQASADKQGLRLIAGAEAKTVCYEKSSTLNGYSPLSQVRQDAGGQRLDELIGRTPEGGVLIENPWTRELIKAVPTKEAEGLLLAKGLVKAIEAPAKNSEHSAASYAAAVQKIKANTEARITDWYEEKLEEQVRQAIIDTDDEDARDLADSSVLLAYFGRELTYQAGSEALEALGLDDAPPESLTRSQIYRVAALYMAIGDARVQEAIAKLNGIALGRLREDAKEQVKAEIAAEIAALKKPPRPTAPLAQPDTVPAADAKPKKPAPLRKPKLSAQDAQLGIAEAMQGMEEGASAVAAESGDVDAALLDQALQVITDSDKVSISHLQRVLRVGYNTAARLLEGLEQRGDLSAMDSSGFRALLKRAPQASQPFTIGQRVRVLEQPEMQLAAWKWRGKEGVIKEQVNAFRWSVSFKGRNGGVADFHVSEIEAVAA